MREPVGSSSPRGKSVTDETCYYSCEDCNDLPTDEDYLGYDHPRRTLHYKREGPTEFGISPNISAYLVSTVGYCFRNGGRQNE